MVHFKPSQAKDWSGEDIKPRPMVVRRGIFDSEDDIEDGMTLQSLFRVICWLLLGNKSH